MITEACHFLGKKPYTTAVAFCLTVTSHSTGYETDYFINCTGAGEIYAGN